MAKYDDFGRPIYETAEEYNRAHRTGNSTYTYDSPEGDAYKHKSMNKTYRSQKTAGQYVSQTPFKRKSMTIGIVVCFVIMVMFLLLVIFSMVRSSYGGVYEVIEENIDDVVVNVDEEYGEYLGDNTTPLPEGFETFVYNGQIYNLPSTFEKINQMGFSLEEAYDELYMLPEEYDETLILNDEDGYFAAMIHVSNTTGEEIPLRKGQVTYFYLENPVAYDQTEANPDFVFGDGLTFESSYEEVEAYFGVPYYHYEDHSEENCFYDNYEWSYYGEDETHFVSITFWNGVISDVGIEKRVIE